MHCTIVSQTLSRFAEVLISIQERIKIVGVLVMFIHGWI